MKISRPIFTAVCLAGLISPVKAQTAAPRVAALEPRQPATGATPDPQAVGASTAPQANAAPQDSTAQQADALLARSEQMLDGVSSLSARIRSRVELFDQQIMGEGLYLQQGRGGDRLSRFELRSHVKDTAALLLQICDGRYFWTYRELAGEATLTQVNLERVRIAIETAAASPTPTAAPPMLAPPTQLSIGGLPRLVAGIRHSFQFTRLGEAQLGQQRCWVLEGQISPALLIAAAPDQKGTVDAGKQIDQKRWPAQLPERVTLYISQANLTPCRIDYFRRAAKGERGVEGGAPAGYRPLVMLELFDVSLNPAIDPRQLSYQPKGIIVSDATEAYIKSLGVQPPQK